MTKRDASTNCSVTTRQVISNHSVRTLDGHAGDATFMNEVEGKTQQRTGVMGGLRLPIKKGDFLFINYTGKVKETGEMFDTTREEEAKKEKLYKEGEIYEPKLVVVGENWVLKTLDESLLKFKIKKKDVVEIPPEKAFGNRDPEKVRLVPLRRLAARGITPKLGMQLEYDGKLATVRTMGSGRIQLDFNPRLAGKTLVYEVTVEKKLKTNLEKTGALIHRRIPAVEAKKFKYKVAKTSATVNLPEEAFYVEGIQLAKRGIAMDLQRFLPGIKTVKFVETFKKQETGARKSKKKRG